MPSGTTSSERARVLLVDDCDAMRASAATALAADCDVIGSVNDGPAALRAATILQPDVIVLDLCMPGMTGLEVVARLRSAGSSAAVVFLTVHDDLEIVEAAKAAGAVGFVVKRRLACDLTCAVREAREGRPFVSERC
jgi:DNA-binding NarL/FixJ family response regulator